MGRQFLPSKKSPRPISAMAGRPLTNRKTQIRNTANTDASTEGGDTSSEGGRIFGYTCMDGTNPFFVALENSIREVVEANGDTLISMDPANDSNTQIDQIEDMISRGVEVMFVNPVDADGIIPALDMLKDARTIILEMVSA